MNYGRKIEEVNHVTLSGAIKALKVLRSGQICRVDAVKKDGTLRTYSSCRTGVSKGVTGAGRKYDAEAKGLITVFEMGVGFRTIAIDRIIGIKNSGVWYNLNAINQEVHPSHPLSRSYLGKRTIPAANSPLYK